MLHTELNERMKKSGLHTGPHVYHQADPGGLATVPVLNLTDRVVTLRPGLGLGTFEHAGVEEVQARPRKVQRPTTAKQKKGEYLRQLVNNAKEVKRKGKEKQGFDTVKATTAEKEAWLIRTFDLRRKPCLAKPKALKGAVDSYIKAVRDWALPKYKTEARAFLGIVGYYRQHIKDYAKLARPWTDVTGKEADPEREKGPLTVTLEMRKAFESLKEALTTAPVLGFPYFSGPKAGQLILDTDFCQTQTAGILSQLQKGKEVVIAYGSKKLNKSQRNYPSTKGELYAGIMWRDKYQYYLLHGPTFKWRTDNVALKHVRAMEPKGAIVERWLDMLATYDFEVEHRAGTKHTNADALSRAGCPEPADPEVETTVMEVGKEARVGMRARDLNLAQNQDPVLRRLKEWVRRRHEPSPLEVREFPGEGATYVGFLKDLEIGENRILMRRLPARALEPRPRVACVPENLKRDVIRTTHVEGGHMGIGTTVDRLKGRVYFPKMKAEVEDYIRSCSICQRKTRKNGDQRHTLVSPTAGYPFQRLHVDLVGPLNESSRTRAKYILTCRDAFSKWPEVFALKDIDALTIVQTLEKEMFARYGYPDAIHSDQGPQFMAKLFKQLQPQLGIKVTNTTGYNPKGNDQVERMHRDLGSILRALTTECGDPFE